MSNMWRLFQVIVWKHIFKKEATLKAALNLLFAYPGDALAHAAWGATHFFEESVKGNMVAR